MKTRTLALVLQLAALTYWSCAGSRQLRIRSTNFGQEIALSQNLVFEFNRAAVQEPSSGWEATEYVQFSPAVPGRFKWISPTELMFSPAIGFRPGTAYTATLTEALAQQTRQPVETGTAIEFHTPWLQIVQADAWWSAGERPGSRVARARLRLNYPVSPADVQAKLKVQIDDQAAPVQITGSRDDIEYELLLPGRENQQEAADLQLELAAGLRCIDCEQAAAQPLTYRLSLPDPNRYQVLRVETEHNGTRGTVRVITSHTPATLAIGAHTTVTEAASYYWGESTPFTDFTLTPQSNGFVIEGGFDADTRYRLNLAGQSAAFSGQTLGKKEEHDLQFGVSGQSIAFASNTGMYLTRNGNRYVGVRIHNVDRIRVRIIKIYENNLLHFMKQNRSYYYDYYDSDNRENLRQYFQLNEYYDTRDFGDLISEKEYVVSDLGLDQGQRLLKIDFEDLRRQYRGAFVVEVGAKDQYYVRASKLLVLSDLGLTYDKGQQTGLALVHNLSDAKPVSGVELNLISSNNQTMATQRSDGQGAAVFNLSQSPEPAFVPALLTARTADDFSFLALEYSQVPTSRYDVGGKTTAGRSYDAWIYGPREIYRPGETIACNALVRGFDGQTPARMPVELRFSDPEGRTVRRLNATLNDQGASAQTLETSPNAPTGSWRIELFSGAGELLASQSVLVEEFVPDRIRVDLKTDRETYRWTEAISLNLQADYFFGSPASFRNYEVEFQVKKKAFQPKGWEEYSFSLHDEIKLGESQRAGQLDAAGRTAERLPLEASWQDAGLLSGRIFATVFDENGRPVHRYREVDILTQNLFYGIGRFDRYLTSGSPCRIPLCAVDAQGKPASNVYAHVRIVQYEYESVLERVYGQLRYKSRRRARTALERTVAFKDGKAELDFSPPASGDYEVQVSRPGARSYVAREFFAYGWGSTGAASFGINTEGQIDLVSDKNEYNVGEEARILFKTPFDGRLLIRLEQGEIITHQQIETKERAAELRLKFRQHYVPTVYVAATLIRPHGSSPQPLTVAYGFLPLVVRQPDDRLPVKITAAAESRSLRRQTIRVQTEAGAELTLAAVDEGILQLRNTPTPDPYAWLYGRRALEVTSHSGYGLLLPELGRNPGTFATSSTGGDMAFELGRRNNPFTSKDQKAIAFWSGPLRANASGIVEWNIDLPQFSGALRVMCVAYKGRRMGSAEQAMRVSDPLVISTALPRFLTPGDTLSLPVTLFNTTKQGLQAKASVSVKGPLKLLGGGQQAASVAAQAESRLLFNLAAGPGVGLAQVEVAVQSGGETYRQVTELSVRPAAPLSRQTGGGSVAAGQSASFQVPGGDFVAGTQRGRLVVSALPVVELGRSISELLAYPHGCAEQTISTAFPQLYLTELSSKFAPPTQKVQSGPAAHVQTAISRVLGQQLSDGGIGMWPGSEVSYPWTSIYAAHFLLEAQRAGYEVPAENLEQLQDYVQQVAARRPFSNASDRMQIAQVTRRDALYALYVSTLAGNKNIPLLNHYREQAEKLETDERYLLAGAYGLTGNRSAMNELLPKGFGEIETPREAGLSFASPLRDRALALTALLEAEPAHPQITELARQVSTRLRNTEYPTTQELAFSLAALGRMARRARLDNPRGEIRIGQQAAQAFSGDDWAASQPVLGQKVEIKSTAGTLYYYWEVEGVSRSGEVPAEDRNLQVRRALLARNGTPVGGAVSQGDLLVVRLTVGTVNGERLPHVVISDLLPAGFEVENPRISQTPEFAWTNNASASRHVDYRDDRVHVFADLVGGQQVYYYVVRAVSPGRFRWGPPAAEAMYDPSYRSTGTGEVIRVMPRELPTAGL